jgi:hypothetical protein
MNSWKRILDILKEELKNELREDLLEELKGVVREIIKTEEPTNSVSKPKDYMHMIDLLTEYKISKRIFFACRKQNYFHDYRQGKYKVYHVEQFFDSLRKYVPKKPNFSKKAKG